MGASNNEIKGSATEDTSLILRSEGLSSTTTSFSTTGGVKLSKAEVEDLREAFRLFDVDNKGVISFQELKEVADALALEHGNKENTLSSLSFRQLSDVLCEVQNQGVGAAGSADDDDNDFELDEEAFIRLLGERPEVDDGRDEYQRVFDLFDTKGKGYINVGDLRKVSLELGESMTDEELHEMIQKAAPNTMKVTKTEFEAIMTKRLFS